MLSTKKLFVHVCRETGSIRYETSEGVSLLSEKQRESKLVEEFDAYKTIINEKTKSEIIQTPDGAKRVVRASDRVFDKKLFHTRLNLEFAKD